MRVLKKMFPVILKLLVASPEAEVKSAKQEELIKQARDAYFGRIRTLIPAASGQYNGIIRTAFR